MKKTLSLFVAALFCATMFAETKTIYCKVTADWWNYDYDNHTAVGLYAWNSTGEIAAWPGVQMTAVANHQDTWSYELDESFTNVVFLRISQDGKYKGVKTADLTIPTDGNNMYLITKETRDWDKDPEALSEEDGHWTKLDKFYITGILGAWNPDAIQSTEDSYTVENVPAGHHAMKLTNGTWNFVRGFANLSDFNKYLYPDQDGNVCFYLSEEANVTVTYIAGEPETFTVTSEKLELPSVKLIGAGEKFGDWDEEKAIEFEPASDELSASKTFTLAKDEHVYFRIIRAGELLTVEGENNTDYGLSRNNNAVGGFFRQEEGKKCADLTADVDGNYTFTWTYATGVITITFPDTTTAIINTNVENQTVKRIINGQLIIEKLGVRYNILGTEVR